MTINETITAAINDFTERGYVSAEQLAYWQRMIRKAAIAELVPQHKLAEVLNRSMATVYTRMIDKGGILAAHDGVSRFTVEKLRPQLRAELNRRIMASADLIKLNRERAVEETLQRFSGWATSVPTGGSNAVDKRETRQNIGKSMKQLPFAERRVLIDQGAKLVASLNNVIATDRGAIALAWHSRWRVPGYNYRPDHKERDQLVYAIRGNWAIEKGLMKKGPAGYYDDVTSVGEEPFCQCTARYIYALSKLPADMRTKKGEAELQRVREQLHAA